MSYNSKYSGQQVEELLDQVANGGGSSSGSGAYAEVNHGTSDTTFTLTPNTFHVWDEVASLDLSFADEQVGVANEYLFQFTSGTTATTLTLPDVKWANDTAPTIAENKIYQISILKGFGSVLEFSYSGGLIENKLTITSGGMAESVFIFEFPVASDITIQYTNSFGDSGTSTIPIGGQITSTEFEPGNETITSVIISPKSDNTFIYTQ